MATLYSLFGILLLKIAHAQYPYYAPPSYYPPYSYPAYNYPQYPPTNYPQSLPPPPPPQPSYPPQIIPPSYAPIGPRPSQTANVYYLPQEKPKASIIKEKTVSPLYPCPLCDGFKDVIPNSKVPPPPKRSVLPDLKDLIPTIDLEDDVKKKTEDFLSKLSPKLLELCEKPKSPKYRFDEDLLEGFLTGLGLDKSDLTN